VGFKEFVMKKKRSERGQAIILLTAGIITLLGFAALAIDGGRLYSERRRIQGVADTTAMTGALYLAHQEFVGSTEMAVAEQEALDRAAENGYDSSMVSVTVDNTSDPGFFIVTAQIDSDVQPVLAQLIYSGDFQVAAKSMARVENNNVPKPFALGQAFFSINKTACRAIDMIGNNTTTIIGSGLFSNSSCCGSKGAINAQGSAGIDITGDLSAAGCITVGGAASVSVGGTNPGEDSYELPLLTEPDCDGLPTLTDAGPTLSAGIYPGGISVVAGTTLNMDPGLYCLDGDLSVNSGALIGNGVTIFMRSGKVSITGGDNVLTAPTSGEADDASGASWDGMLIFQAYGNTSNLKITGNSMSSYSGTIFVPDGHCTLVGEGGSTALDTQFVCDTIDISGTADIVLSYTQTDKYFPPPPVTISLVE
jgi:hypothetical protein